MILRYVHAATMWGVSDDGIRVGLLQYGNKVYTELELGAARNLREFTSRTLHVQYRNDGYNDLSAALEAATEMLKSR